MTLGCASAVVVGAGAGVAGAAVAGAAAVGAGRAGARLIADDTGPLENSLASGGGASLSL